MKITCQSCQSKYTVSDEKVQGKTVKIKCRKCGATILVSSTGATTTNAGGAADAVDAAPTTAAGSYLVNVAEGDQRTMTLQELVDAYNTSVVTADTYVWSDGMSDWQPLSQVEAITSALQPSGASAAPEPAAPRAAARRDPAKRSADLFGSGGEQASADVGTGSPLFKSSASAPKPKQGGEENSMLFSLSALTAKAAPSEGSSARALNNEDSGIIDLKALTAAAESRNKAKEAPSSGLSGLGGMGGMMPDDGGLFLAPPVLTAPAAPAVVAPIEAPQKNRTPLFIGIGATVAVAAIIGAFVVMKGGPEPTPTPATESTQVAAAPTPTPTPTPAPTPTVEASAAPSTSAVAANTKGGTAKPGGGGKAPPGGAATTASKPAGGGTPPGGATTAAAPVKKSNCNCPPGDLMCAMKCSTN